MKQVMAHIQPHMLDKVMDALHALPHFPGMTVSDCQGQGRGLGRGRQFQPTPQTVFFTKKVTLELICSDDTADDIVSTIARAAKTGHPGDGVITVADVARVVRIRTGEEGKGAV
jgi:nitrogen regulatory protein P-II 1